MKGVNVKDYGAFSISELIRKLKRYSKQTVIYKGIKIKSSGNPEIIYVIAIGEKVELSRNIIECGHDTVITKKNTARDSYIKFICWDKLCINNGQLTGSNMNMLNDTRKYSTLLLCTL